MDLTVKEEFLHPPRTFSPIPFWFWNDTLSEAEIQRQILDFHEKGVNGFVIHPRMGLPREIEYLSDTYMQYVRFAVEEAARLDMQVVLYDEAAYPSGSAHGLVVKENPRYASKALRVSNGSDIGEDESPVAVLWVHKTNGSIDAVSETEQAGFEKQYYVQHFTKGHIRGIHYGEDDGEAEAPPSADLLCRDATEAFLRITHDRYYTWLAPHFGKTVIAFFTDEPSIMGRGKMKGKIPWTDGFLEYFIERGGHITDLPKLFSEEVSPEKQRYREAIRALLSRDFYTPMADWCHRHGIALTGHPEKSEDIGYLAHFDIPCQDLVWRYVEPHDIRGGITGAHSTMAKCASDSARHRGKRRCGNEVLGVCGPKGDPWGLSYEDMMWFFNWLFVRGNNIIFPHAFFYSLAGLRRNERPPDVGPHSPWWKDYRQVSDYIGRMCALNTDSVNQAQIAVLCTADHLSWEAAVPLYESQLEFNYLEAELLSECEIGETIRIAHQSYRVLIVDTTSAITAEQIACLRSFQGQIIQYPRPIDAFPNALCAMDEASLVPMVRRFVEPALETEGTCSDLRVSHVRKGGEDFLLLFNEGHAACTFGLPGSGQIWDPRDGSMTEAAGEYTLSAGQLVVFACNIR